MSRGGGQGEERAALCDKCAGALVSNRQNWLQLSGENVDNRSIEMMQQDLAEVKELLLNAQGQRSPTENLTTKEHIESLAIASSEYQNRALINWRRVRSAIEHENALVNNRINWLLLSQGGILTAFAALYNKWLEAAGIVAPRLGMSASAPLSTAISPISTGSDRFSVYSSILPVPLILLAAIGIFIAINIWLSLRDGVLQNSRLTKWWYGEDLANLANRETEGKSIEASPALDVSHPPIHLWHETEFHFRGKPLRPAWLRTESIPLYFVTVWIFLLIAVILPLWLSPTYVASLFEWGEKAAPWLGTLLLGVALKTVADRYRKERKF